ncbi:MAG: hypothetical protein ACE5JG_08530, partial [Planctomycetota bacterium]
GGGMYRFKLAESRSNPGFHIRVTVEQRNGGNTPLQGNLPLNVFLADGIPITPASATGDAKLQSTLQVMDDLLAQVGLRIGPVSYFKLTDPSFDTVDVATSFEALQTQSAAAPEARLNLFFVNAFTNPNLLGVAGGTPGLKRNGTIYSGVAMGYDGFDASFLGSTAAHEAGHYLGLYHTTEYDQFGFPVFPFFDNIEDTPICPVDFTTVECPTIGNDNLLWPFDIPGVAPEDYLLTHGQGHVLLSHPLVEPGPPRGGGGSPFTRRAAPAGAGGVLPLRTRRSWCANCAGRYPIAKR